jgi:hypothetical protein
MINVAVEDVLPVLAVLAASVLVSSLFLAMERLIKPKSWLRPDHLPVLAQADQSRSCGRTTKRLETSVVPGPMKVLPKQ